MTMSMELVIFALAFPGCFDDAKCKIPTALNGAIASGVLITLIQLPAATIGHDITHRFLSRCLL